METERKYEASRKNIEARISKLCCHIETINKLLLYIKCRPYSEPII